MDKPLTVKELYEVLRNDILEGRGDYTITLSTDDEGNSYHYCWCTTIPASEVFNSEEEAYAMGLDNDIAEINKTIILG